MRLNCYTLTYTPARPCLYFYYFRIITADERVHLIHANEQMRAELDLPTDRYWQLTVYSPDMHRPAALGTGILYQGRRQNSRSW